MIWKKNNLLSTWEGNNLCIRGLTHDISKMSWHVDALSYITVIRAGAHNTITVINVTQLIITATMFTCLSSHQHHDLSLWQLSCASWEMFFLWLPYMVNVAIVLELKNTSVVAASVLPKKLGISITSYLVFTENNERKLHLKILQKEPCVLLKLELHKPRRHFPKSTVCLAKHSCSSVAESLRHWPWSETSPALNLYWERLLDIIPGISLSLSCHLSSINKRKNTPLKKSLFVLLSPHFSSAAMHRLGKPKEGILY